MQTIKIILTAIAVVVAASWASAQRADAGIISTTCGSDATSAINSALTTDGYASLPACPQSNPLLISATIQMPNGSTLCGQGHTSTWLKEIDSGNLAPVIGGNNAGGGANIQLNNDITVCGFSVDGNGLNQSASSSNRCLYFLGVADLKIDDVGVRNCRSNSIFVDGNGAVVGPCEIGNIYISGTIGPGPTWGYGLSVSHAARWCTIHDAYVENTVETAFLVDASETTWSNLYSNNAGGASFVGTASGTTLTVTSVSGILETGDILTGPSSTQTPTPVTITGQTSGSTGGPGVYTLSGSVSQAAAIKFIAIGVACHNSGVQTVNNPGGGGASQSAWTPCPAGAWVRNVTNTTITNATFAKGGYYGAVITGALHSAFSNIVATNNSLSSNGVWDDLHFDYNVILPGYGEDHAIALTGATVGSNGQTLSSGSTSISPPTSRYGIFVNDGLPGSMGDASIVSGGTGYAFGNSLSCSGGTSTEVCKFVVAGAPGGPIKLLNRDTSGGSGVYTVLPSNPVSLTGGAGTGATVNVTWSSAYLTGINCGQTVTGCTRIPAFAPNWTVQTNP